MNIPFPPRIVVLDGYTLNPGDLSWAGLQALGNCTIHERTAPAEVLERAADARILLTNKTPLDRATLRSLPDLRYIGVLATGVNVVDLIAARECGIPVTNVPAYSTASVVQLTFALLFELTHHVGEHAADVRAGQWSRSPDFCYWKTPLLEVAGLNFGILGYGRIGQGVARVARSFGMNVLVHTRSQPPVAEGIQLVDRETLFREADVVSLHCPLTPETRHLVNAERLALMKPTAFLLNTSRGPLVDETALAAALHAGQLAGAGLDVLGTEPPPGTNPLPAAPHTVITPHLGWATRAARQRLMAAAVENVRAFLAGERRNVVAAG